MELINSLSHWLNTSKTVSDIITGLWASGIFLFILTLLKPKIKICDKIAFTYNRNAPAGEKHLYSFKVVNKSWFFKVYDMQISAWISKIEPSTNADDISYQQIKLRKNFQWVIHRLYLGHLFQDLRIGDKRLEERTDYAAQFSTFDDIKSRIESGHFVTIEIIAKHALTGFSRVLTKKYKHTADIVKGTYYSGNSCKIKT